LAALSGDFAALYSGIGRPSVPPEKLLRAMLLQAFYSVRSEQQLMERIEFDLLFRWFVGIGIDDPAWDHSSFTKSRDRLLEGEIAAKFLAATLSQPRVKRLLSSEHFSVDLAARRRRPVPASYSTAMKDLLRPPCFKVDDLGVDLPFFGGQRL
jgi:transposase